MPITTKKSGAEILNRMVRRVIITSSYPRPRLDRRCYTVFMKALQVNGKPTQTNASTVKDLLDELGLAGQAVAVELNQDVVPKSQHEQTELTDGDRLELVTLVGGG